MRLVFADTLYWGAALHPHDQYRAQVIRAREARGEVRLVTTDEVLTELLDGLAQRGTHLREAAVRAVRRILDDRRVTVHPFRGAVTRLRASTHAGKTSGFSSQTSIHCAISSFRAFFSGAVRGFRAANLARSLAAITWRRQ